MPSDLSRLPSLCLEATTDLSIGFAMLGGGKLKPNGVVKEEEDQ